MTIALAGREVEYAAYFRPDMQMALPPRYGGHRQSLMRKYFWQRLASYYAMPQAYARRRDGLRWRFSAI